MQLAAVQPCGARCRVLSLEGHLGESLLFCLYVTLQLVDLVLEGRDLCLRMSRVYTLHMQGFEEHSYSNTHLKCAEVFRYCRSCGVCKAHWCQTRKTYCQLCHSLCVAPRARCPTYQQLVGYTGG